MSHTRPNLCSKTHTTRPTLKNVFQNSDDANHGRSYTIIMVIMISLIFGGTISTNGIAAHVNPKIQTQSLSLYGPTDHGNTLTHYAHVNPNAPKGGTITRAASGTFDSLNPFVIKGTPAAGLVYLYASMVYATLMDQSHNEPFSQYGYLAASVAFAKDRKSITYTIRQNATFHDGTPITVDDVIFSFKILIKKGLPLFRKYYADVTAVEKVGPHSVKFTFKDDQNKELHLLLGTFPILSKASIEKYGFDSSLEIPNGSGPYRISKFDIGRSIDYKRIQNWWGETLPVNIGRYNIDRIRYLYFRDPDVSFEAFKSHDYDFRYENEIKKWMTGYDSEILESGEMKQLLINSVQAGVMNGLIMNMRRVKFQDRRVRKALTLIFDFEWLNDNYFYNQYERTTSFFWGLDLASKGSLADAKNSTERTYLQTHRHLISKALQADIFESEFKLPITDATGRDRRFLKQAKALLRDAGYGLVEGKLVHSQTQKPLELEILLAQQSSTRLLGAYIKSLKRLGITAKFRIVDTAQYTARVEDFDFDMVMQPIYQSNSPGNEQIEFWGSTVADIKGSQNLSGLKNKAVDAIIEDIIDAKDRAHLETYVRALDRVLLWTYLAVPLWGSKTFRLAHWDRTKIGNGRIRHTGNFSKYHFDAHSLWIETETEKP